MNKDIKTYYETLDKKFKFEGGSGDTPAQRRRLQQICIDYKCKNIMEIGFNAGHSADLFLNTKDDIVVTSFDIGQHNYVLYGKSFIDQKYPFRHNLIIGDSKKTVNQFRENNLGVKFDLIFIDGDHSELGAITDLVNSNYLAHKDTIVVLDDTRTSGPIQKWNVGPNYAWKKCVDSSYIYEISSEDYENEERVLSSAGSRGQSWGRYANAK
jgi:predicted O-methyltransferase YrrM